MNTRSHIAAIAGTLDEARQLCRQYGIPTSNAVSIRSAEYRGRAFAGYILDHGFQPPPEFWGKFTPGLLCTPKYTAAELRVMLADAERREAEWAQWLAELTQDAK